MSNKALAGIPVFYINVDGSHNRNLSMLRQFKRYKIDNYYRVSASKPENISISYKDTSKLELACFESHILAIKAFIEKTSARYALICEDDVDMSQVEKIDGHILDALEINNVQCLQACISLRKEDSLIIKPHRKNFFEFGAIAYFVERSYAQRLLSTFIKDERLSVDNFAQSTILDPRGGVTYLRPVADHAIYDSKTITIPIFSIVPMTSEIDHNQEEDISQLFGSIEKHAEAWSKIDSISLNYEWQVDDCL